MAVRFLFTFVLAVAVTPAAAFPRSAPPTPHSVAVPVQDRFLPRIFGRGGDNTDNAGVRIDQLEAEIRRLNGEVEQLRFAVEQLQRAMGQGGALPQATSRPQPQLQSAPVQPAPAAPAPQAAVPAPSGPIDLSALNTRFDDAAVGGFGGAPSAPLSQQQQPAVPPQAQPAPTTPQLAQARAAMASGRYAVAADQARSVISAGSDLTVASEARFLVGEALMAQGDLRGAANYFLENYTTNPNGARAPESLVRLSRAFNQLGEPEAACSSIEELFGAYPTVAPGLRAQAEQERQTARCS